MDGGQVVDGGVLQHRQEDKDKADPEINVHRLNVGHPGHGRIHSGDDGGHGQHGGDACTDMPLWFSYSKSLDAKLTRQTSVKVVRMVSRSAIGGDTGGM